MNNKKTMNLGELVLQYPEKILINDKFKINGNCENAHHFAIEIDKVWYQYYGNKFEHKLRLSEEGVVAIKVCVRSTKSSNDQNTQYISKEIKISVLSVEHQNRINLFLEIAHNEYKKGFEERKNDLGVGNNKTLYGEWYGMNNVPWCAIFISYCAGKSDLLYNVIPKYSYCPSGVIWYKKRKRYYSRTTFYTPKSGDIVFLGSNTSKNRTTHTGIVYGVNQELKLICTIEGNVKDKVVSRIFSMKSKRIKGYGANWGNTDGGFL